MKQQFYAGQYRKIAAAFTTTAAAFIIASCSSITPYIDEEITEIPEESLERFSDAAAGNRAPEILVLLSFSGGGTRAASFAYGVLQELADTPVSTSRGAQSLLSEVDVISSVSGGSFTSAYFGLYGSRIFDDFEARFLRKDVEKVLKKDLFRVKDWNKLESKTYGRSDMAADYYDEQIFDGKTFADIRRPEAPLVIINTSELGGGMRLTFTPGFFDLMCINLDKYPVSRAVAASSAVPGLATPITLENFAGSCDYQAPQWLLARANDPATTPSRVRTENLQRLMDAKQQQWLHLADGGITDDIGLRAFYTLYDQAWNPRQALRDFGHSNVSQILVISVNAAARHPAPAWTKQPEVPKVVEVLRRASDIQMERFSAETINLVRNSYQQLAESLSTEDKPVSVEFVEVNFHSVDDPRLRKELNAIATNFGLEDTEVDKLIGAGRQVLRQSNDFQRFVERNSTSSP
jgi:NTE family protein